MTPAADFFRVLTPTNRLPARAVVLSALFALLILLVGLAMRQVFQTLISGVIGAMYVAFLFPVAAALFLHLTGRHRTGPFSLGRWSFPVTLVASIWLAAEIINVAWPRQGDLPWYQNWAIVMVIGVLSGAAVLVYGTVIRGRGRAATDANDRRANAGAIAAADAEEKFGRS